MIPRIVSIILLSCLGVSASEVVKVGPANTTAYLSQDKERTWKEEDRACLFRNEKPVTCGTVTKATPQFAKIRLPSSKVEIRAGDQAYLALAMRELSNYPLVVEDKKKKEATYNTVVGLNLALDRIFPKVELQGMLTPNTAVGIQPGYTQSITYDRAYKLTAYGVMFTFNYYGTEPYRGFWLQAGSGLYFISENTSGAMVHRDAPILAGSIGWREKWALGMNIGIAIGARYLTFPEVAVGDLQFKKFQATVMADIGIAY